jgi:hypothetical protein
MASSRIFGSLQFCNSQRVREKMAGKLFCIFSTRAFVVELVYGQKGRPQVSALITGKDSIADQIEPSRHSKSLSNSQPFTADQDGPYHDLSEYCVLTGNFKLPFRSRHFTSLHKSQPFRLMKMCQIILLNHINLPCAGKRTSHVTLFKHLFSLHWNSLHTLPQSYWDNIKERTKLTICHPQKNMEL